MRIYYYNIGNFDARYKKWQEGKLPGHTLYGLTHFQKYGIDTVIHRPRRFFQVIKVDLYFKNNSFV